MFLVGPHQFFSTDSTSSGLHSRQLLNWLAHCVLQMVPCLDSSFSFLCTFMSINTSHSCSFDMNYKLRVTMNLGLNLVNNLWCNLSVKPWWTYWNQWEGSHSVSLFSENWIKTLATFKTFTWFKFQMQYCIHRIDGSKPDRQSWVRTTVSY